jgi:hypothetical protein
MTFQKLHSKKDQAFNAISRESTPENKRKGAAADDDYMPSPSQTPTSASTSGSANDKKKKQKTTALDTKIGSGLIATPEPPAKTKFTGNQLDINNLMKHPKAFQNIDKDEYQFSTKGKIHKLVDRDGQDVTFLMTGNISVAHVGKYGNWNEEYDKTIDRARFTILIQAVEGYETQHASLIEKLQELEKRQYGAGTDFMAEDKQLVVKAGNRILLKRKVWRFSDDLTKRPLVDDDHGRTLWEDAIRSKKEPNFYPNGAYDFNGMRFY